MTTQENEIVQMQTGPEPTAQEDTNEPKLRMIPEGEAFRASQTIDAEAGLVEAVFAVRYNEGSPRYEKRVTLDFSGVSKEKLLDLALYEIKQKVQGMLRKLGPEGMLLENAYCAVDVQTQIVEKERTPGGKPTLAKIAKGLGLTEEQAIELLKRGMASPAPKAQGKKR